MPLISITDYVDTIKMYLDKVFADDCGISFHVNDDPTSGENSSIPVIYKYTMPTSSLVNGYPAHCPCIVITVDESNSETHVWSLTLHLCICYPSIAEQEKVHETVKGSGVYEYEEISTDYDTESSMNLLKSSIIFTEKVYNMMMLQKLLEMSNVSVELPDPSLEDYPYCISAIHFNVKVNPFRVSQDAVNDLY